MENEWKFHMKLDVKREISNNIKVEIWFSSIFYFWISVLYLFGEKSYFDDREDKFGCNYSFSLIRRTENIKTETKFINLVHIFVFINVTLILRHPSLTSKNSLKMKPCFKIRPHFRPFEWLPASETGIKEEHEMTSELFIKNVSNI